MEGILVFGFIAAAFAAFDVLAIRFGVDSHLDSFDSRSPARGISL